MVSPLSLGVESVSIGRCVPCMEINRRRLLATLSHLCKSSHRLIDEIFKSSEALNAHSNDNDSASLSFFQHNLLLRLPSFFLYFFFFFVFFFLLRYVRWYPDICLRYAQPLLLSFVEVRFTLKSYRSTRNVNLHICNSGQQGRVSFSIDLHLDPGKQIHVGTQSCAKYKSLGIIIVLWN